jgi:hypothetical protein
MQEETNKHEYTLYTVKSDLSVKRLQTCKTLKELETIYELQKNFLRFPLFISEDGAKSFVQLLKQNNVIRPRKVMSEETKAKIREALKNNKNAKKG